MNEHESFVIAISGPSGAGKTTLVARLVAELSPATQLSYDHYYRSVAAWECNVAEWVQQGSDPNHFISIPRFVADLQALRSGQGITSPRDEVIPPAPIIVVEEPWGRQRREIAPLILSSTLTSLLMYRSHDAYYVMPTMDVIRLRLFGRTWLNRFALFMCNSKRVQQVLT